MRKLPLNDPGVADHRSPDRYLWWLAKGQWRTIVGGMLFGIIWMSTQAVMPAVIGRAIDRGVAAKDPSQLWWWGGVMLTIGLVQAVAGIIRHRFAVTNFLTTAYRTVQLVARQVDHLGGALPRRVSTGEVVAVGNSDISTLGQVMDVSARFTGAIVSFILVAVILLQSSLTLGLLVLLGVPTLMLLIGPLLSPLQRRGMAQRELTGHLSNTASDIVGGLRVLRGIGGEQVFSSRYRRESQQVRRAGASVARIQSLLDALQVFLPGLFVVIVVWLGARYAVQGRISAGELVAFYGYAAFLMIPLRTATEFANKFIRGRVSARRVCHVLALEPDLHPLTDPDPSPAAGQALTDTRSGLVVEPGELTALVSEHPESTALLADRLGLQSGDPDAEVALGGVPLIRLQPAEVHSRIVVSDTGSQLFSGVLRGQLLGSMGGTRADPNEHPTDMHATDAHATEVEESLRQALFTASAGDVLDALEGGLDGEVAEHGRSFSGGQRQRLVLARALLADPEILILVEPTSAVDAHTEARIADRLHQHRAGRTTVVTTSSPLLLDAADRVAFLEEGRVTASGTHRDLLETCPAYRATVTREVADEPNEPNAPNNTDTNTDNLDFEAVR